MHHDRPTVRHKPTQMKLGKLFSWRTFMLALHENYTITRFALAKGCLGELLGSWSKFSTTAICYTRCRFNFFFFSSTAYSCHRALMPPCLARRVLPPRHSVLPASSPAARAAAPLAPPPRSRPGAAPPLAPPQHPSPAGRGPTACTAPLLVPPLQSRPCNWCCTVASPSPRSRPCSRLCATAGLSPEPLPCWSRHYNPHSSAAGPSPAGTALQPVLPTREHNPAPRPATVGPTLALARGLPPRSGPSIGLPRAARPAPPWPDAGGKEMCFLSFSPLFIFQKLYESIS